MTYHETPRKVHLFHDQKGAMVPHRSYAFANTLCKMNSNVPESHITTDPEKVTCKICRKDARFKGLINLQFGKLRDQPGLWVQQIGRAIRPGRVNGMRTRHRRNWRGKLILQVEVQVPVNYDHSDPRELRAVEDVPHTGRWRDATLADMGGGIV